MKNELNFGEAFGNFLDAFNAYLTDFNKALDDVIAEKENKCKQEPEKKPCEKEETPQSYEHYFENEYLNDELVKHIEKEYKNGECTLDVCENNEPKCLAKKCECNNGIEEKAADLRWANQELVKVNIELNKEVEQLKENIAQLKEELAAEQKYADRLEEKLDKIEAIFE